MNKPIAICLVTASRFDAYTEELADLLNACVQEGASIGFIIPHPVSESLAFWCERVRPGLLLGTRQLLVATCDGRVTGSVQLISDMFPNQTHRADVSKLMVHPQFRRRGIARALMEELQNLACQHERKLLTLDTISGSSAESLYLSLGFKRAGEIPNYARHVFENRLEPTTIMYKML
ncbi:MAG: GNAT family N-acetyltransferase [Rhodospirillales bacterium]|nr:GNAT family N-acetyltransferase [Rhodospirillales bacterium]